MSYDYYLQRKEGLPRKFKSGEIKSVLASDFKEIIETIENDEVTCFEVRYSDKYVDAFFEYSFQPDEEAYWTSVHYGADDEGSNRFDADLKKIVLKLDMEVLDPQSSIKWISPEVFTGEYAKPQTYDQVFKVKSAAYPDYPHQTKKALKEYFILYYIRSFDLSGNNEYFLTVGGDRLPASKVNPGETLQQVVQREMNDYTGSSTYKIINFDKHDKAQDKFGNWLPRFKVEVLVPYFVTTVADTDWNMQWINNGSQDKGNDTNASKYVVLKRKNINEPCLKSGTILETFEHDYSHISSQINQGKTDGFTMSLSRSGIDAIDFNFSEKVKGYVAKCPFVFTNGKFDKFYKFIINVSKKLDLVICGVDPNGPTFNPDELTINDLKTICNQDDEDFSRKMEIDTQAITKDKYFVMYFIVSKNPLNNAKNYLHYYNGGRPLSRVLPGQTLAQVTRDDVMETTGQSQFEIVDVRLNDQASDKFGNWLPRYAVTVKVPRIDVQQARTKELMEWVSANN
jgi:hypothetical protein